MVKESNDYMYLKFAEGDADVMGLLVRVRMQKQEEKFSKSVEKREREKNREKEGATSNRKDQSD